jgi:hypothetical protein
VLLSGAGDTTPPITDAQISGTAGSNGYYVSPVKLTFTAQDPDDAPNTLVTTVLVNGVAQSDNPITLGADGTYNVAYWSVDPAGNREVTEQQVVHIDRTAPSISASANPNVLWPPNHKFVPVVVTGHVSDNLSGINRTVTYQVADEYHQVQPSGSAQVDSQGNYRFVVDLQSSRLGQDKNGRQYVVRVTAHDVAGNQATASSGVLVPHDMGHGFRGRFSGPIPVHPRRPNFAELRRERLAAQEHAIQVRRAEAEARRQHQIAIRDAQKHQQQLRRQAIAHPIQVAHGRGKPAVPQPSQVRSGPAHRLIALPVGNDHGNHGNSHGNQGHGNHGNSHGNHGNGHGKK